MLRGILYALCILDLPPLVMAGLCWRPIWDHLQRCRYMKQAQKFGQ